MMLIGLEISCIFFFIFNSVELLNSGDEMVSSILLKRKLSSFRDVLELPADMELLAVS